MTNMLGHVENPSAKVQFSQVPQTAPGQCAICGSGQDKNGFIDTGLDFDFWGRVFFCFNCGLQLAAVFGFISPLDYADLEAELDFNKLELESANEEIKNLRGILDGVSGLNKLLDASLVRNIPVVEVLKSAPESSTPSESEPVQSPNGPSKQDAGESGETSKPANKQRLLNL